MEQYIFHYYYIYIRESLIGLMMVNHELFHFNCNDKVQDMPNTMARIAPPK